MQIREYKESDLEQLKAIHARQGFDYPFPDLSNPLFVSRLLLSQNDGKILGAALLRLTSEAYLLLDPNEGSPRDRWQSLVTLHFATHRDAWRRGLEDVHAWLPPQIATRFGRRLQCLGWIRDDAYTPYCRRLEAPK